MYARGVWFPLDTPMRNKFWLLARGQACNRCVNRFGTSSFVHGRPNSCHCVRQLHADIVSQQRRATVGEPGAKEAVLAATARMRRHGHVPARHCLWKLLASRYGGLLVQHPAHGVQGLDLQGDYLHRILLNFCGAYFCGTVNSILASISGAIETFNDRLRRAPKQHDRHGGAPFRRCPVKTATKPTKAGEKAPKGGAKSAQHIKEVSRSCIPIQHDNISGWTVRAYSPICA
jgi:hypothetical protein